jgi:hypothetical protein
MGVGVFVCLLTGPHARWVKRFLPNTANRAMFVIIVTGIIVAWIVQALELMKRDGRGQEYFSLTFALLCSCAL